MSSSYDWNGAIGADDPALALPTIAMTNAYTNFTNQLGLVYPLPQPTTAPNVSAIPVHAHSATGWTQRQRDAFPGGASAFMDLDNLPPSPPVTPENQIFPLPNTSGGSPSHDTCCPSGAIFAGVTVWDASSLNTAANHMSYTEGMTAGRFIGRQLERQADHVGFQEGQSIGQVAREKEKNDAKEAGRLQGRKACINEANERFQIEKKRFENEKAQIIADIIAKTEGAVGEARRLAEEQARVDQQALAKKITRLEAQLKAAQNDLTTYLVKNEQCAASKKDAKKANNKIKELNTKIKALRQRLR